MSVLTTFIHTRPLRWLADNRRALSIIVLVVLAALIASPELRITRPAKAFATRTVCAVGCNFTTIQAAVNGSAAGDTINVQAGVYPELVMVTKTLTINGPNANINPCTGARVAEAVVGIPTGAFQVVGGVNGVVINGFTVQGVMDVPGSLEAGIHALNSNGTQILNNIVQNNVIGIAVGGDSVLIQNNSIRNNNNVGPSGGTGIYSDTGLTNSTINANCFTGQLNQATNIIGAPVVGPVVNNVALTNNTAVNDSGYAFFGGSNLTVTGNSNVGNVNNSNYFFSSVNGAVVRSNLALNGAFS